MRIFGYNNVVYKGNINRDFYLFCLKKNKKIIKYVFISIWYYILSLLFYSKKDDFIKHKYLYLREVSDLNKRIIEFYQKNRLNNIIELTKDDIIIDKVPEILILGKEGTKIGYEFDNNYIIDLEKYNNKLSKVKKAQELFIRRKSELKNIASSKIFIVRNNIFCYIKKRKYLKERTIKLLTIALLSFILTCISFCYTNYVIDLKQISFYFEPKLFLLNYIPIFLLLSFFSIITKKIHISFLINSILILLLGISNQTKLLYRDDVVKFEDLTIIKEAMIMSQRYSIFIKWYTLVLIFMLIFVFLLIKKYIKKIRLNTKKTAIAIFCIISSFVVVYSTILINDNVYYSVGNTKYINVWITTRQSQIRGLVYPFIKSIDEMKDEKPTNYSEEKAKKLLDKYHYENIKDNEKVNIIAIMLEAYNDFSKFDKIDFNEDIYEKFHQIEDNSISGNIVTTIFGGGTITTERDFLTGYYAFPSFRKPTNSYVWYFKEQGYKIEAMHPIFGGFYNRSSVDINLGFDMFYNYDNTYSNVQKNFLDDYDFFDYIIEGYEKSKKEGKPYFNFSVTYQNHGPYSSANYDDKEFFFDNNGYEESAYNTINEYFSGIKKTNLALEKLINYFDNEEEPTIIIFFGDHNPYLGENGYDELGINLDLSTTTGFENYYETPYVIHANNSTKQIFNKNFIEKNNNVSPIFLMNELFNYCGWKGNEYLQYMNDLRETFDVINPHYYRENGKYVTEEEIENKKLLEEFRIVNYYYSRNFKGEVK